METSSTSSSEVESMQNDVYRDNSLITVNDTLLSIETITCKTAELGIT